VRKLHTLSVRKCVLPVDDAEAMSHSHVENTEEEDDSHFINGMLIVFYRWTIDIGYCVRLIWLLLPVYKVAIRRDYSDDTVSDSI